MACAAMTNACGAHLDRRRNASRKRKTGRRLARGRLLFRTHRRRSRPCQARQQLASVVVMAAVTAMTVSATAMHTTAMHDAATMTVPDPSVKAASAAPAITTAIGITAPVPARAMPAGVIEAIVATADDELRLLDEAEAAGRIAETRHARRRRLRRSGTEANGHNQCQSNFSHEDPH
jgi:hypothetical protein